MRARLGSLPLLLSWLTVSVLSYPKSEEALDSGRFLSRGRNHPSDLFARADSAGCASVGLSDDYSSCGLGLPDNFCCNTKRGETCKSFNDGQSSICCPSGSDCTRILQVSCNAQFLNVTAPDSAAAPIHSSLINGGLIICTKQCCPVGYLCAPDDNQSCVLAKTLPDRLPSSNSSGTIASQPNGTSSNTPGATSIGASQANSPGGVTDSNQCPAYPVSAVLVGLFPGLVGGLALALVLMRCWLYCSGSDRSQRVDHLDSESSKNAPLTTHAAHGPVSDPIYHDTGTTRVDFLRHISHRHRSPRTPAMSATAVGTPPTVGSEQRMRPPGLFSGTLKRKGFGSRSNGGHGGHGGSPIVSPATPATTITTTATDPKTPRQRSPSMESITIFNLSDAQFGGTGATPHTAELPGTHFNFTTPDKIMSPLSAAAAAAAAAAAREGGTHQAGPRDTQWHDLVSGAGGLGTGLGVITSTNTTSTTGVGPTGTSTPKPVPPPPRPAQPPFLGSPGMVDGRRRPLDGSTRIR